MQQEMKRMFVLFICTSCIFHFRQFPPNGFNVLDDFFPLTEIKQDIVKSSAIFNLVY